MIQRYFFVWVCCTLFKAVMSAVFFFVLLAASTVPVQAGYYFRYDKDVHGKVFDADTQQPLAGLVVMAMWVTQHTRITIEPEDKYYVISKH